MATADDSWSSFQNGGIVSQPSNAELALGDIQWQANLQGYGQSSAVVWEQHVYINTVEGDNKDNYHVTACQVADGRELWQHTGANASPAASGNYISQAAPWPAVANLAWCASSKVTTLSR